MLLGIREFFNSKAGYATSLGLIVAAVVFLFLSVRSNLGASEISSIAGDRTAVCSETGKSWNFTLKPDMTFPIDSSYSGKKTGWPADTTCTWTADGKVDSEVTYVILNETAGRKGATFCPKCHRQVVRDNPAASPDRKPPPTDKEYAAARSSR
jgi:hypothetical protein